jgi:glutamate decarboxylase
MPTFTLNFSRPGNQIVGQYYNFLRLGREGYTRIMEALRDTTLYLSAEIAKMGPFEIISDGSAIPVMAFKMKGNQPFTVFHVSEQLRTGGWQVPAYTMPADATDVAVLRIVVREGLSFDLAEGLVAALRKAVDHLTAFPPAHPAEPEHFSHT